MKPDAAGMKRKCTCGHRHNIHRDFDTGEYGQRCRAWLNGAAMCGCRRFRDQAGRFLESDEGLSLLKGFHEGICTAEVFVDWLDEHGIKASRLVHLYWNESGDSLRPILVEWVRRHRGESAADSVAYWHRSLVDGLKFAVQRSFEKAAGIVDYELHEVSNET